MQRAAIFLLFAGCTSPTTVSQFDQTPLTPLQLQISSEPPPDSGGFIVRDALLRITMDDYPDPDSVVFGALLLRSGTATFDVEMHVDLVGRGITVRPSSLLRPNTDYELVIGAGLRALSGRTVGTTLAAPLSVGGDLNPSPSPSPSPAPTWVDDISPLLTQCAPYCHSPDRCPGSNPPKRNASRNLDFSAEPDDPVLGLVGVASVALAGTDHPMIRVQPGDSAHSELLRKILGGDPHADTEDPPTPNLGVPGRRMPLYETICNQPPDPDPAKFFFTEAQARLVQDWIDQGAQ